jgi:hypothetical protein
MVGTSQVSTFSIQPIEKGYIMTTAKTTPALFNQLVVKGGQLIGASHTKQNLDFEDALATFASDVENGRVPRSRLLEATAFFQNLTQPNAAGTTPLAVGSGNGTFDELAAVQVLVNSDKLTIGVKRVIQRVLAEASDPMRIAVESDGTPSDLILTRKANTDLTAETLSLKKDIQDSRDELAMAKQSPAGTMATAIVSAGAEAMHTILGKGKVRQGILLNPAFTLSEADYLLLIEANNKLLDASKVTAPKSAAPKPTPPPTRKP